MSEKWTDNCIRIGIVCKGCNKAISDSTFDESFIMAKWENVKKRAIEDGWINQDDYMGYSWYCSDCWGRELGV